MRRVHAELILATVLSSLSLAADTHIDAPMPPYCNPRGNWAECAPDVTTTSAIDFSTQELDAIVESHPFVRKKTHRAFAVAGGYAKLTLRWTESDSEPYANLAVVSRRPFGSRTATELAERFQEILDQEGALQVDIERFAWPWQREPEAEWCVLSRNIIEEAWAADCGAEAATPHN